MRLLVTIAVSLLALASCNRTDPPDSAPTNVTPKAGDGVVLLSWDALPDLTYWIFYRPGATVTAAETGSIAIRGAIQPRVVSGLVNGTEYAFVVNATHQGSKAGPSSPVVTAKPMLAGDTWISGAPLATADLNGLAFSGARFVAVGDGATIFAADANYGSSNPPGVTAWLPPTASLPPEVVGKNLSSVLWNGSAYVAMAADGTIIASADGFNWVLNGTRVPAPAGVNMNAIVFAPISGVPTYIAVGDSGTIFTGNLVAWTQQPSGTANNLNGVSVANVFLIATGVQGTLLVSPNGADWFPQSTGTTATLRSAAFSAFITGANYVAVGDGGTVLTTSPIIDPSAVTWNLMVLAGAPNLRSVTVGGASLARFLAVGLGGAVVHSDNGLQWDSAPAPPASDLSRVLFANFMYMAVGAAGANAISK